MIAFIVVICICIVIVLALIGGAVVIDIAYAYIQKRRIEKLWGRKK